MQYLKVSSNGSYFLFMTLLYVVSPLLCFIIALLLYRRTVSHFFYVAYAFFFGYQLGANYDLMMHYQNYLTFWDRSFVESYTDFETLYLGQEPFHFVFKYLLSRFNASQRVFSGCACAIYAIIVTFYLRQYQHIYLGRMDFSQLLLLFIMAVVIEYYWYFGLRFWNGAFIFMILYSKHVITGKKIYIFLTPLCLLFHVAMATVVVVAFASHLLKNQRLVTYLLFATSFVFKFISFKFDKMMASFGFVKSFYKVNYQKDFYHKAIEKVTKEKLLEGNFVYNNRIPLMLFFFFIVVFALWVKNKNVNRRYSQMFAMILLMIAFANIGYSDYVFYERFLKFAALIAYSYMFLLFAEPANKWICKHLFVTVPLLVIGVLSLVIALVQQRLIISDLSLWLGNFFSDVSLSEIHNNGYK